MKWQKYGWQLGKITDTITAPSQRPHHVSSRSTTSASFGPTVRRKQGPRDSRREQLRFRRRGEIRLVGHLEEQEGSPLGVSPFLDYFWIATGLLTCE